jgi:hypothetical protein
MQKNLQRIGCRIFYFILLPVVSIYLLGCILSAFLSKTDRVSANILLVEGWLPPEDIKAALNEYRINKYDYIITTGMKPVFEGCILYENGYLVFYPKNKFSSEIKPCKHTFEIDAYSSTGGENSSKFNFYVNDSIAGSFIAGTKENKFVTHWNGSLSRIDSVTVQFINDKYTEFYDRNLYVRSVTFDHSITIPTLYYSEYDRGKWDGKNRVRNNVNSNAEQARNLLMSLGVDSSSVISVPGRRVKINRTLTSALALHDWLLTHEVKVTGINIISSGSHARRTWMTYHKVLDRSYNIGIISLPEIKSQRRVKIMFKPFREAIAIIYYWIILIPY